MNKEKKTFLKFTENPLIVFFILCATLLLLFGHTLSYPPDKLDENVILIKNLNTLKNTASLTEIIRKDAFMSNAGIDFYRPAQNLSFYIDAKLSGKKYHLFRITNLMLHLLCCIVLYLIIGAITKKTTASFLLSLIFAIHPLQTQAILWLPARGDLLCALFILLSFLMIIRWKNEHRIIWLFLSVVFYFPAIFSKEIALFYPMLLVPFLFPCLKDKKNIRPIFVLCILHLLIIFIYLFSRHQIINNDVSADKYGLAVLIKNWRVLPEIIAKTIFPILQSSMPVFTPLNTITGIICMLLLAALFIIKKTTTDVIIWTGIAWFFIFLLPGMAFSVSEPEFAYHYLEHRAYLPLAGSFLAVSAIQVNLIKKNQQLLFISYLILLMILSVRRSYIYQNAISFYSDAIATNPRAALAYNNRGLAYYSTGQTRKAINDYTFAIRYKPDFYNALFNRATALFESADYKAAIDDYSRSLQLINSYADAWHNRGVARYHTGDYVNALNDFSETIKRNPSSMTGYFNKGLCENALKRYADAINSFTHAISISPSNYDAWNNRGISHFYSGFPEKAIADYTQALLLKPDYTQAIYNRGLAYSAAGNIKAACDEWKNYYSLTNDTTVLQWIKNYCRK